MFVAVSPVGGVNLLLSGSFATLSRALRIDRRPIGSPPVVVATGLPSAADPKVARTTMLSWVCGSYPHERVVAQQLPVCRTSGPTWPGCSRIRTVQIVRIG